MKAYKLQFWLINGLWLRSILPLKTLFKGKSSVVKWRISESGVPSWIFCGTPIAIGVSVKLFVLNHAVNKKHT